MSYLYRPTPVFNPGPSRDVPMTRLPAGTMHGYYPSDGFKTLNGNARRGLKGDPWIVRSGTMGRFGMGDDTTDFTDLPLPTNIDTTTLDFTSSLPSDFWGSISAPIAPASVAYNPGPEPSIVSSGGSILGPSSSALPQIPGVAANTSSSNSLASLISSISSLGTSITKAVTGQTTGINPAIAPLAPSWLTQSTMISGIPDIFVWLGGGVVILGIVGAVAKGR